MINEIPSISIFESGTWILLEILRARIVSKTKFSKKPQIVFDVKQEDNEIKSIWIPLRVGTRSKYFTFLTAATGDFFLSTKDKIEPLSLEGKFILGCWGKEKTSKGGFIDAFIRFLPSGFSSFETAKKDSETVGRKEKPKPQPIKTPEEPAHVKKPNIPKELPEGPREQAPPKPTSGSHKEYQEVSIKKIESVKL